VADILLCRSGGNRTYKHTPVHKVGGKTKFDKRVANKKIRRSGKDNLENAYSCKSNDYRKENESWHIWDYRFFLGGGEPIWRAESWRNIEGKLWEKLYKRK
jgi:hypothetical protein